MTEELTPTDSTSAQERLEMYLAQALTRAELSDVRQHLQAALKESQTRFMISLVE
jgi:hypothetical protein